MCSLHAYITSLYLFEYPMAPWTNGPSNTDSAETLPIKDKQNSKVNCCDFFMGNYLRY